MSQIQLDIVTPEKRAYSEMVDHVVIPGTEGEMDVYPKHAAMMLMIKPGELRAAIGHKFVDLAVGEGFVEITGSSVTILTDVALTIDQIDEGRVEEALKRAQEALKARTGDTDETAALESVIEKSVAQLMLKRRRH